MVLVLYNITITILYVITLVSDRVGTVFFSLVIIVTYFNHIHILYCFIYFTDRWYKFEVKREDE